MSSIMISNQPIVEGSFNFMPNKRRELHRTEPGGLKETEKQPIVRQWAELQIDNHRKDACSIEYSEILAGNSHRPRVTTARQLPRRRIRMDRAGPPAAAGASVVVSRGLRGCHVNSS